MTAKKTGRPLKMVAAAKEHRLKAEKLELALNKKLFPDAPVEHDDKVVTAADSDTVALENDSLQLAAAATTVRSDAAPAGAQGLPAQTTAAEAEAHAAAHAATGHATATAPAGLGGISSSAWLLGAVVVGGLAAAGGGGGGGGSSPATPTLSGTAIDGYLRNANVYLDKNGDGIAQNGELAGTTDAQGHFSIQNPNGYGLIITGGVNVDTGLTNSMVLKAPGASSGSIVVSPLTTLIQAMMVSESMTLTQAESTVQNALGIPGNIDLTSLDTISSNNVAAQKAAVQIATALVTLGLTQSDQIVSNVLDGLAQQLHDNSSLTLLQALQNSITSNAPAANAPAIISLLTTIEAATTISGISDAQQATLGEVLVDSSADKDTAATLVVADLLVNNSEKSEVGFTVAGLDSDARGVVTFTDGTHTVTVNVTANGNATADLSTLTDGTITSSLAITDVAGNTASATGTSIVLDSSADKDTAATLVVGDLLVGDAEKTAVSFTVAGLDADATAVVTFSDGTHTVTANVAADGSATADLSTLTDGTITSSLAITDAAGNTASATGTTVVLDTSADKDTAASLVVNDLLVGDAEKTAVSFTVAGLDTDASAVVTFSDGTHTVTANVAADGSATVDLSTLTDGNITSSLAITDTAGNTATIDGTEIVLDTSADKDTAATLVVNDLLVGDAEKTAVSFTVAGLDTDATAVVTFSDGTHTVTANVAADGSATADLSTLTDGTITSSLAITDAAGNTASVDGTEIVLDTSADKDTAASLVVNDLLVNNTEKTAVSFTVAGLDSDATAVVTFSDGTHTVTADVAADGSATADLSTLTDGTITSSLAITDAAGNTASATGTEIVLDTSADKATAATLVVADTLVNNTEKTAVSFTVAGLDSDASAVVTFSDGTHTVTADVAADGSATVDLSTLTDGTITSVLDITDTAGNTASVDGTEIVLDTSADKDTAASLVVNDLLVNNTEKTAVSFTVAGLDTDATAVVTFSDGTHTVTANVAADGTATADLSTLTDGNITSSLAITDAAGNTASATGTTVVLDTSADKDTAASLVVNDLLVGDAEKTAVSFTVAGLDSDATAVVTFSDGSHTVTANVAADGSATVDLSTLTDGSITSSLAITDTAGNTATIDGTEIVLDTSADKDTAATLVVADLLVGDAEKTAVSFTVAGLDTDATAVVTFSDGTHTVTANVAADGSATADLSTLTDGTITSVLDITDTAGNTASVDGTEIVLDTSADKDTAASLVVNDLLVGDAEKTAVSFTVAGLDADATAVVTFSDGTHTVTANVAADGSATADLSTLTDGTITSVLDITDLAGNTASVDGTEIVLDTSADKDTAASLVVNDLLVGDAEKTAVSFTVAGLDADATAVVTFSDGTHTVTANVAADGSATADLSTLTDGTITSVLDITDTAGNTASVDGTEIVLDTSADKDTAATLVVNDLLVGDAEKTAVSFTVAGLDADATAVVTFSDGTHTVTANVAADGSATADLSTLTDGTITSVLDITDTAGNTASVDGTEIVLDTSADKDTAATLVVADLLVGDAEKTAVSFTVAGLDTDASAVVTFSDGIHTVTANVAADGSATADLSTLTDGTITSSLAITDAAGNTASAAGTEIVLDTSADKDTAASLELADTLVNNTEKTAVSFTVAGLDVDASAVVTFSDGTHTVTANVAADGSATVDLSTLTDGNITSSLAITDAAGNTASATGTTIVLDTSADKDTAATLVVNDLLVGDAEKTAVSFTVAGLDADATFDENGVVVVTFSDGTHTVTVNVAADGTATADLSTLTDGTITSSLAITDTAGNTASATGTTIVLDTSADKDTAGSLVVNDLLVGDAEKTAVSFTVAGLDVDASAVVTFSDGTHTVTANVAADGSATADLSTLTDGTITSSLAITDAAGNTASATGTEIVLDTTAPVDATLAVTGASNGLNLTEATSAVVVDITPDAGAHVVSAVVDSTALSLNNDVYTFDATGLSQGDHVVTVVTEDAAGNQTTTTQHFSVDTVAPVASSYAIDGNTLTFTLTDVGGLPAALDASKFTVHVGAHDALVDSATISGDTVTLTLSDADIDTVGIQNVSRADQVTLTYNATAVVDTAGNGATLVNQQIVHNDTVSVAPLSVASSLAITEQYVDNLHVSAVLTLSGSDFQDLLDVGNGEGSGVVDIKDRLDWSHLTWTYDGNGATHTFAADEIASVHVLSDNSMEITLTANAWASLGGSGNLLGQNGADQLSITSGFFHTADGIAGTSTAALSTETSGVALTMVNNGDTFAPAVHASIVDVSVVNVSDGGIFSAVGLTHAESINFNTLDAAHSVTFADLGSLSASQGALNLGPDVAGSVTINLDHVSGAGVYNSGSGTVNVFLADQVGADQNGNLIDHVLLNGTMNVNFDVTVGAVDLDSGVQTLISVTGGFDSHMTFFGFDTAEDKIGLGGDFANVNWNDLANDFTSNAGDTAGKHLFYDTTSGVLSYDADADWGTSNDTVVVLTLADTPPLLNANNITQIV